MCSIDLIFLPVFIKEISEFLNCMMFNINWILRRGRGLVRHGDGLQRSLRMMNNGSTDKLMMTRWSTDAIRAPACRRDPSIVSSNLTDPTF